MRSGLFDDVPFKDKVVGWSIIGLPLATLAVLGAIFLRPDPIDKQVVEGCYVADGAPSLDIQRELIHIIGERQQSFRYEAEPFKEGYHLVVRPALNLAPLPGGGYAFKEERGIGYFWSLLPRASDRTRDMRKPTDYGGRFQIVASDGQTIVYTRTDGRNTCR